MKKLILATSLVASSLVAAEGWRTYSNIRYGFATCYPPFATPLREADNGDGRSFRSKDGFSMLAYGTNNAENISLKSEVAQRAEPGQVVSYTASRPGWIVQSGNRGANIFWQKVFERRDQYISVLISYPKARQAQFGSSVSVVNRCFKVGEASY